MATPNWHIKDIKVCSKGIALDRFRRYLDGLGLRKETVQLYLGRVKDFLDYAQNDFPSPDIGTEYRAFLIEEKFSRSHINNSCFAVKHFFQMNGIEWTFLKLKPDEGVPYYFEKQDVLAIFSVCSNLKHLSMLKLLFFSALRSSELARLDDSDLDLKNKTLRLRETKGKRDDITYINDECVDILLTYLRIRPQIHIGERIPLFYTDHMNVWNKKEIHRMFLYYKKKAGIKKPGAVQVFSRHTSATIMIASGCDCRIVKEILRHRDIRTTLKYAHLSDKTKREKYDQYLTL